MKDNARDIARLVVLAQDASDAGKGSSYLEIKDRGTRFTQEAGYSAKNKYIQLALKRISTCKPCGWNFYVNKEDDQNGYPSVLTYFQYRANGKRYDICFHTPFYQAENMFSEFIGKGRRTHWNGIIGGSRRDCQSLIDLFDL